MNRLLRPRSVTFTTLSLTTLFIAACGGGGGGDDRDAIPSQCRSYCSFTCSKASSCGYFPGAEIATCDDSCVRTIASNGGSAASCERQGQTVAAASCSQLGTILGLRSFDNASNDTYKQNNTSTAVSEHCGAELALAAGNS